MIASEVRAWSGHERGEARHPILGREQHVGCAIAEGVSEFEHDPAGGIDGEALEGDGRACDVSGEALELVALNGGACDGGVEREPLQVCSEWLGRGGPCERR